MFHSLKKNNSDYLIDEPNDLKIPILKITEFISSCLEIGAASAHILINIVNG